MKLNTIVETQVPMTDSLAKIKSLFPSTAYCMKFNLQPDGYDDEPSIVSVWAETITYDKVVKHWVQIVSDCFSVEKSFPSKDTITEIMLNHLNNMWDDAHTDYNEDPHDDGSDKWDSNAKLKIKWLSKWDAAMGYVHSQYDTFVEVASRLKDPVIIQLVDFTEDDIGNAFSYDDEYVSGWGWIAMEREIYNLCDRFYKLKTKGVG